MALIEKPSKGQVLINDIDATQYDANVVRTKMTVLFQDFRTILQKSTLTPGKYEDLSVFDNIAIGRGQGNVDLKSVTEAAGISGIHPKVRTWESYYRTRLRSSEADSDDGDDDDNEPTSPSSKPKTKRPVPFMVKVLKGDLHRQATARGKDLNFSSAEVDDSEKINTRIPKWDVGMQAREEYVHCEWLSGGQWQKVAMARAFMKIKEAELLILDEPSSALDPQAEYELFKTLMDLRRGKTTVFIVPNSSPLDVNNSHIDFILFEQRRRLWYFPFLFRCADLVV